MASDRLPVAPASHEGNVALNQDNGLHPGYSMVELPRQLPPKSERDGYPALNLQRLEQQTIELNADIKAAQDELAGMATRATAAIQAENADAVTAAWAEKQRVAMRLSELQRARSDVQQAFDAAVGAIWDALQRERAEMLKLDSEHDAALQDLIAAAEALRETAERVAAKHWEWKAHQQAWEAHLEHLEGRAVPVPTTSSSAARSLSHRLGMPPAGGKPERAQTRQWSVYNPDAGRLVETAGELLKLLVRWYPALHSHEERVHEFLAMPNAEPLPERLRKELQGRGLM